LVRIGIVWMGAERTVGIRIPTGPAPIGSGPGRRNGPAPNPAPVAKPTPFTPEQQQTHARRH
jgi:hypothetical protein